MRIILLLLFLGIFYCPIVSYSQKKEVILVIDPGHGGNDPGHLSSNAKHLSEKELNLKIAQYLGGYIEKYLQNVKVVYTRTGDSYPSLNDRVEKANSNNADYFISIHCNGNERRSVHGTESHVHSMGAKKSVTLAREIEKQFSYRAGRHSRGVKDKDDLQHSLQVLKETEMTSVLVECGFLTNEKEAAFLNTQNGQEIIASAIFRAFRSIIQKEFPAISFIRTEPSNQNQTAGAGTKYTIQIMSSKTPVKENDSSFKKLGMNVIRKELDTRSAYKYIYLVGEYSDKEQAKTDLTKVQQRGFKDAIIVKI